MFVGTGRRRKMLHCGRTSGFFIYKAGTKDCEEWCLHLPIFSNRNVKKIRGGRKRTNVKPRGFSCNIYFSMIAVSVLEDKTFFPLNFTLSKNDSCITHLNPGLKE